MPVTVTVTAPVAALALALNFRVDEHVGVQPVGEKAAVTPDGRAEVLKLTLPGVPEVMVAVTRVDVADP